MEQVAAGVYRLGRRLHNFYLLSEGGKATVVDTGGSRELPLLEAGLASVGLTLDDVEAVLITHAHTDHLGSAGRISNRGVPVKVHEDEAAYARDNSAGSQVGTTDLPLWNPRAYVFLFEMIRAGAHRSYRVQNVETVTDGERLDLPGRPRVIATPGHTNGHAGYLFETYRVLCSGDALVTDGLISRRAGPQLMDRRFHADPDRARASLNKLAGLAADLILPGHGPPWQGSPAEAVEFAKG